MIEKHSRAHLYLMVERIRNIYTTARVFTIRIRRSHGLCFENYVHVDAGVCIYEFACIEAI